jgi:ribonucleotide monophosphatase NagD (HAD superfamily)
MLRKITDLDQLTEHADVLLCDVWGVIHNGVNPFALSVEALKAARARGQAVILITNSPRPARV